jgi:hypothetical protein
MSARTLMAKLQPFEGKRLIDCIDEIKAISESMRYSVNVVDPAFNIFNIDNDYSRLNVRTNAAGTITSFTIG